MARRSAIPGAIEAQRKRDLVPAAEYLEAEERATVRHEYVDGVVYAMVGGRIAHDIIATDILVAIEEVRCVRLGSGAIPRFGSGAGLGTHDRMKTESFTAILEREGDLYVALCPELDVASQGSTVEQAVANLREAVELFLECADPVEVQQRLHTDVYVTRFEARRG